MRIVIADQMEEEVVAGIRKLGDVAYKPADVKAALADADALIVRSATKVTRELLAGAGKLRVVARAGVGLDNVDQKACEEKGIKVMNTSGASTNAVAELALALMLAMLRNVQKAHHQMKSGLWDKKNLTGSEVDGKTLGVIGYGRIGAGLAAKAKALGMTVIAYNPPPRREDGNAEFVGKLDALLARADIISLHVPTTPQTANMINRGSIAKMKDGVYIVNTARGDIIDEDALYEGCKSGKIAGAAIDVYRQEPYKGKLLELDNVYFTPHLGASTKEAQARIGAELVKILKEELKG
ncbi:3-phosphoglycerate dehydrogenase [Candidatus Micrarchaeota archaeon]|nr:3-phosphoglycerate dehydrogenase [Candidatus Micrarchaeota archaeon]